MSTAKVDFINIGLMIVSVIVAFVMPLQLFLLAYAILGPLHYLTEMSWLHDRKYFLPETWLALPIGLLTFTSIVSTHYFDLIQIPELFSWNAESTFGALALSLVFLITRTKQGRLVGAGAVVAACVLAHYVNAQVKDFSGNATAITAYESIFMVFLTTIIHVFVFTGAFILFGALKTSSRSGYLSFLIFLGCAAACFLIQIKGVEEVPTFSAETLGNYNHMMGGVLSQLTGFPQFVEQTNPTTQSAEMVINPDLYHTGTGVAVARFIAYAYTYHYLNWFSKTSVIRWHDVPRVRFVAVIVIWIVSLVLYAVSYEMGLYWLLLLSMLHVFLEFPLNWHSFFGIGRELYSRARPT